MTKDKLIQLLAAAINATPQFYDCYICNFDCDTTPDWDDGGQEGHWSRHELHCSYRLAMRALEEYQNGLVTS